MFTLLFNHHQQASPESSPTARPWPSPFHLLPLWLGYSRDFMSEWFAQSCLTLCNPMDWSLPGSSVHGILQARLLDWVAISFSRNKLINLCESHPVVSNFLWPHGLYSPWNSPGQNTGVGSLSLLQGIFPNQGSNPGLLHCSRILYKLSHRGPE